MFKKLLFLYTVLFTTIIYSQGFSSIWDTEQIGSPNNEIRIPTNPAFTYNYDIDWGDGATDTNVVGNITHTYATPGIYTVEITGDFPAIYFNNTGDRRKIIEILSWGNIQWQSMEAAFYGCQNLNFDAINAPDLSNVTTLQDMFRRCSAFNGILNNWDVSGVTNISGIFSDAIVFNRPLDNWVTNSITDMSSVFENASLFNEPLDNWNTAAVENMENMFSGASLFNQDINNWIVTQVTNMTGTFRATVSFNRPLNNWVVNNVTNMSRMFSSSAFNQNIAGWNVGAVTNMSEMFSNTQFNQPIESWNVGLVTDMSFMFSSNRSFNQPLNNWDVSNVENMRSMFRGSGAFPTIFNQPLNLWDVSSVQNMSSMFEVAEFNQPINDWEVGNVTDMSNMFSGFSTFIYNFNQPLDQWDVSSVTNMSGMFQSSPFNQPIGNWDVTNVENMSSMFRLAGDFNQPLDSWVVTSLNNTSNMFQNASAFNQPLNGWTVNNVTSMQNMFSNALAFNQPLNNWNTDLVVNMQSMFADALAFNQSLADWNISQVTDMTSMLNNTALSLENYDATLIGWAAQTVSNNVSLGADGLTYCDGREERQELIDTNGWSITGDTVNCSFVLCTSFSSPTNGDTNVPANFDLRWNPAPNATGYNISVSYVRGGVTTVILDNSDEGNVVGIDFTTDFQPGDIVTAQVVPYNGDGPATGCEEITFTVVPNWRDGTDAFKLTIDTRNVTFPGNYSNANQFRITARSGVTYNYSIDWGDNQFDNNVDNTITHTYLTPGIYTIAIIGDYPAHFYPTPFADNDKLLTIDQWGTIEWEILESSFYSCGGFTGYNATDTPDLSRVTDISRMFESSNFNGNINNWDVSNVENMARTFIGMSLFNQPLNDWDVGNVTDMSDMFLSTRNFNQPLNQWDVSKVISMRRMFDGFSSNMAFNQNLNDWDVSSVRDMTSMFSFCVDFNQPLNNWVPSSVTTMEEMFDSTTSFNQDISSWDVSAVQSMNGMFRNATDFNQSLDNWTVSAVQNMASMFQNATNFNQSLNQWDVVNVTTMAFMFQEATSFNQSIGNWDVANVINMEAMFRNASVFNQNIDPWNVTSVINMSSMFEVASAFNSPLNNWNVNSVVNMTSMFKDAIAFDQPIGLWDVSAVANMSSMFQNAQLFNQDIQNWNVSSVTLMNAMFEDAGAFASPMQNWQVGSVTRMDNMFKNALVFNSPINNWDTGEVLTMQEMFSGATTFNQNIDSWDVSFVTTMQEMFKDATSYNLAMDSWNVASVNTMFGMFQNATAFNGTIDSWNVRGVTTMESMFDGATSFNQTINSWRVSGVENMNFMFRNASTYNQSMDRWDLGNVTMNAMFLDASALNQTLEDWNISGVSNMANMLDNTALTRENYDNTLIGWSEQTLTSGVTFGALGLPYCDALEERQSIIDSFGWTIVGDVLDCPIPECTQLVSPLNGATDVPVNTNLTWEPSLFARGYRLTVGTTAGGNDIVNNETINNATSYEFAADFTGGETVFVTIIPFNDEGDAIGPCTEESFTISNDAATVPDCTSLISPLNTTTDVVIDTDLSWNPIANADGYRLTVGTSSGASDIVNDEDVNSVTTYNFTSDLPEDTQIFVTITPYNEEGDALTCAEESFTTEIIPVAPACTNISNPLNNATDVPVDTNLSWDAVDGATGYLVVVGTTPGGIEIANNIDVNNTTTYDFPVDLQENRTFYVTIIPYNEVGDAAGCSEQNFRTATIPTAPACTTLNSPADGAIDVAINLASISWGVVANADGYRLTVVGSSSTANNETNLDITSGTTHNFANDFDNGETITITIVPYNAVGDATGCTAESFTIVATTPTVPSCSRLMGPDNGDIDVPVDTDIAWDPIANADGYRLTVTGSSSAANNLVNEDVTTGAFYDLPGNFDNGETVTVTIVPYNAVGDAVGCASESFTIIGSAPSEPTCTTLINPTDGDTDVALNLPSISWNAISNADGYRLTVTGSSSTANNETNLDITSGIAHNFANDFDNGETVTITIVPYNTIGDANGCISESFTIVNPTADLPTCTSLTSPFNGAIDVSPDTDISWEAVANADGYRLTVGTSPRGNDVVANFDAGSALTFDFSGPFADGTVVYVNITPYNTDGDAINCAEESFTIASPMPEVPSCAALSTPTNGATNVNVDTAIVWNEVLGADGYRISVGTTPGGTDILNDEDVSILTAYQLAEELPFNQQIFVSIVPYNAIGDAENCEIESFTTIVEPEVTSQNGLSPDGDGINEFWEINGIENYPNNTVVIYNRWGDMVFKVEGYDNAGNVFNGEANQLTGFGASQLPEGTYFFQIIIPEPNNLKQTKGYLVLKR